MTQRALEALPIAGWYLLLAMAVFPAATIRIGGRLGSDLRTWSDNRKKTI